MSDVRVPREKGEAVTTHKNNERAKPMSEQLVDITSECFGYEDGRVICWRGVNYVRQAAAREAIMQAAGMGAAAIMCKPGLAGEVVMPTEEILGGCERIFQEINDGTIAGDDAPIMEAPPGV